MAHFFTHSDQNVQIDADLKGIFETAKKYRRRFLETVLPASAARWKEPNAALRRFREMPVVRQRLAASAVAWFLA